MADLTKVLRGRPAGEWVVLVKNMTKVIAFGKTPAEALARAKAAMRAPLGATKPILMRVPNSSTTCVY